MSTIDLPVDEDSLPLHLIGAEPKEIERQVGEFMAGNQERLNAYGGLFAALHPHTWKELQAMAKTRRRKLEFDVRPWVESLGPAEVIRQIGPETVIEQLGPDEMLKRMKARDIVAHLPKATRGTQAAVIGAGGRGAVSRGRCGCAGPNQRTGTAALIHVCRLGPLETAKTCGDGK